MIMAIANVPLFSLADTNQLVSPIKNGRQHHPQPLSLLPEQCGSLNQLKQVHGRMLRTGLFFDAYTASKLIYAAALSPYSSMEYARKVFDQMCEPNQYTWSTLIRGYASSEDPEEGLATFTRMLRHCAECPNTFTYSFVIKAATESSQLNFGRAVHGMLIKAILSEDSFMLNSLARLYGSCGDLDSAYRIFVNIPTKDVGCWNSIIMALSQDRPEEVLELFKEMETENIKPNDITLACVLSACAKKLDLERGRWVCCYIARNDIKMTMQLTNAVLDMYMKCGCVEDAENIFHKMPHKDNVSWNIMLDGHAKLGNIDEAKRVFGIIPEKTIASWNTLISAYERNGKPNEALACFLELLPTVKPNEIMLVNALSACAQLGAIDLGGLIHRYLENHNLKLTCEITNALIDMYAKCGDLQKAWEVFCSTNTKHAASWTSMIGGFTMHGHGRDAVDLFLKMHDEKVQPSSDTYAILLSACSRSGFINEGKFYFEEMERIHGIVRGIEHYECMVDLLGRAGLLEEAVELIEKIPMPPNASIWKSLLITCEIHGNIEIAEWGFNKLIAVDPANDAAFVILAKVYARAGNMAGVARVRKQMRDRGGVKEEQGCSYIEVDGTVHEFSVRDISHPRHCEIYRKVEEIAARAKSDGDLLNKSRVLQSFEEEEEMEQAVNVHSEKLAVAFGLISTEPPKPIQVVKNAGVCADFHDFAKIVSRLYDREIVLRECNRFHHFRGGICSCEYC